MNLLNVFSDREKAIIIWFCIVFIALLAIKSVRDNLKESIKILLKILFSAKVGIPLLLMGGYVSLLVFLAYRLNLWNISLLKDTLLWFFGSSCIMFASTDKAGQDSKYFKDALVETLKFGVFVEFVVNLYVFNLYVELVLVPVLFFISVMLVIPGKGTAYARARKVLNGFIVIIGLAMLIFALVHVFGDFTHFATIENAKTFLLPLVLTFAFLPFMYCLTLWARYETLFTRTEILTRNKELASFIKWKLFSKCLLNLNKLNRVFEQCSVDLIASKDKPEVTAIMQRFKHKPIAKPKEM